MNIYERETLYKNEEKFLNHIAEIYEKKGVEAAIKELKMTRICINSLGEGTPRNKGLYDKVLCLISKNEKDKRIVEIFEKEVRLINGLYKNLTQKINCVNEKIPYDKRLFAYMMAVEFFMRSCLNAEPQTLDGVRQVQTQFEQVDDRIGETLKYFMYTDCFCGNCDENIGLSNIKNANKYIELTFEKLLLSTIEEQWSYFDLKVEFCDKYVHFYENKEASQGLKLSAQKFYDVRNAKIVGHTILDNLFGRESGECQFQSLKSLSKDFFEEYFIDDLEQRFCDIPLKDFLVAYTSVSVEAQGFLEKNKNLIPFVVNPKLEDVCLAKTKEEWIELFLRYGVNEQNAERIFKMLIFTRTSKDLYDCPFIMFNNKFFIIPSAVSQSDAARATMSMLTHKKVDISVKGKAFEKNMRSNLAKANIKVFNLKEIMKDEKYECDAVFNIDNDIFFIEAKHLNHPLTCRDYQRNIDEIEVAKEQLNRIYGKFSTEEEKIKELFDIEEIENMHKIVLTNTYIGEVNRQKDVLIVDEATFLGYFKRQTPMLHEIQGEMIISRRMFNEFFEGEITSRQFLEYIYTNPYLALCEGRFVLKELDYRHNLGLKFSAYACEIDSTVNLDIATEKEKKQIKEIFGL